MKTTKQMVKAELELMLNLAEQSKLVGNALAQQLAPSSDDDIYELLTRIQEGSESDIEKVMNRLEGDGYFASARIEEGEEFAFPEISVNNGNLISIALPLNKGKIVCYANDNGCDYETGIMYKDGCETPLDIIYAIQEKKPEDQPADSITVYLYENPYSEDWTSRFTLCQSEIDAALVTEEKEEK